MPVSGFNIRPLGMGGVSGLGPYDPQSSFIQNPQALNSFLQPYGLQVPQLGGNYLFPRADMGQAGGFQGQHPGFFGGLNNALIAMGQTPGAQGPEGWGGGLSRMAQGVAGVPEFKRTKALEQFTAPFQVADLVSGLQQRGAMLDYLHGYSNYLNDRGGAQLQDAQAANIRANTDQQNAQTKAMQAYWSSFGKPVDVRGAKGEFLGSQVLGDNGWEFHPATPEQIQQQQTLETGPNNASMMFGKSLEGQAMGLAMSGDPRGQQMLNFNNLWGAGSSAARARATEPTDELKAVNDRIGGQVQDQLHEANQSYDQLSKMKPSEWSRQFPTQAAYKQAVQQAKTQADFLTKAQTGLSAAMANPMFRDQHGAFDLKSYYDSVDNPQAWAAAHLNHPAQAPSPMPQAGPMGPPPGMVPPSQMNIQPQQPPPDPMMMNYMLQMFGSMGSPQSMGGGGGPMPSGGH